MKKFFDFLKRLFRNLKALADKWVGPAVDTVENIKRIVNSPLVDLATGIIPGTLDDNIVRVLREKLPEVLTVLNIGQKCLEKQTFEAIVLCAINEIRALAPNGRAAAYHSIAAMLAHYASDKKITWSEAVHLAELVFAERTTGETVL